MGTLALTRISLSDPRASAELANLRARLTTQGDILSAHGRELTLRVFGEPLTPSQVVERICNDVRQDGLEALLRYTVQLDGVRLNGTSIRVASEELAEAHAAAHPEFLATIRRVRDRVLEFQKVLLPSDTGVSQPERYDIRIRYRPVRRVGVCIPGGAAAYPSTVLMTVCPAQAAGVQEIAVVVPPSRFGGYNAEVLATCRELGVDEVYRVGGAQAVAALAYGVNGLPAVDMIVGPGNLFVTLAKKFVFGHVKIDMLAGPSEIVVLADDSAKPAHVAADLIAQAEHAPGVAIVVTWHAPLVDELLGCLESRGELPRSNLVRESLENFGAVLLARNAEEGVACVNELAPEHVHIQTRDPLRLADQIENAGAIFLGPYTPVAVGDYVAGPSHVLPTGGTARFASGLAASDFLKRTSILTFTQQGLHQVADDVRRLAETEGLKAHAVSVDTRLSSIPSS
jgi:histidinol dehydrogenase